MNHESKHKYKSGFTLIELIVVISVIGILSVFGIAGFNNYNKVQTLQTAANDVATLLNLAKSRALSQVKLGSVCTTGSPPPPIEKYEVKLDMSGSFNTYHLIIHCGGSSDPIEDKTLPKNITFDAGGTTLTSVFFPVLTGGAETDTGNWDIALTGYTYIRTIKIDSVGGIKVQ